MKSKYLIVSTLMLASGAFGQLSSNLQTIFEDFELMGMSVAVVCGEEIEAHHYGLKNFETQLDIDDSTMYRIASISKLVAATGMMKLYQEGLFQLDEDVSDALGFELRNPNWPDIPITYRMLLSHTGSIQDGTGYSGFLGYTSGNSNPPSISELFLPGGNNYTSNMWRQEEPGTYFTYSNANFGVVGTLIEALSGQRFDVYMKNEILNPLQIAGSFNVADIENINNVAVLYRNQGGWTPQVDDFQGEQPEQLDLTNYEIGTNGFIYGPQGSLRCSVYDLAKLLVVHRNGSWNGVEILNEETLELMHTPQWTYNGSNGDNYYGLFRSWGLGVQVTTDTEGGDHIWEENIFKGHAGEAYGLISDLYWYTDESINGGFVFMTNGIWEGYEFGDVSAFYSLEEAVFQAVNASNLQGCALAMEEVNDAKCFSITNNSNTSQLMITASCALKEFTAKIYEARGMLVQSTMHHTEQTLLNTTALSPGIYHVEIIAGAHQEVHRVLIR
ncbi:MAG: serine hydrolase domain-containing protein [Flavobacteriales bacterium]